MAEQADTEDLALFSPLDYLLSFDCMMDDYDDMKSHHLMKCHSIEDLSKSVPQHQDDSTHVQLAVHHLLSCAPVGLSQVPVETPVCLLEEDEGNEAEIMKIVQESKGKATLQVPPISSIQPSSTTTTITTADMPRHQNNNNNSMSMPHPIKHMKTHKEEGKIHSKRIKDQSNCDVTLHTKSKLKDFLSNKTSLPSQPVAAGEFNSKDQLRNISTKITCKRKRTSQGDKECSNRKRSQNVPKPPPHPATDYGAFIRENQSSVSLKCFTTQEVSRQLGQLWKSLTKEQKEEYALKSCNDQKRYVTELKNYFGIVFEGVIIDDKLALSVLVDDVISDTLQHDDNSLSCQLCQISFCNSYRKSIHFCGRPHCEELLAKLMKLIPERLSIDKDELMPSYLSTPESFDSLEELVSSFCSDAIVDRGNNDTQSNTSDNDSCLTTSDVITDNSNGSSFIMDFNKSSDSIRDDHKLLSLESVCLNELIENNSELSLKICEIEYWLSLYSRSIKYYKHQNSQIQQSFDDLQSKLDQYIKQ